MFIHKLKLCNLNSQTALKSSMIYSFHVEDFVQCVPDSLVDILISAANSTFQYIKSTEKSLQ